MARTLAIALLGLLLVDAAHADDGKIEINQAVLDASGTPFLISASGSYVLTSNLRVGADTDAIQVGASDVTLDLNGFQIICIPGPVLCRDSGATSGFGIVATDRTTIEGTEIRNGTVIGFVNGGIQLGAASIVHHVRAVENGGTGIDVGEASRVTSVLARGNSRGVRLDDGSILTDSAVIGNSGTGVFTTDAGLLLRNAIRSNSTGASTGDGNVIRHSVFMSNSGAGISDGDGSLIADNTITGSGSSGISGGAGETIQRNTFRANTNGALSLSIAQPSVYRFNNISGSAAQQAIDGGFNGGGNFCGGNPC